MIVVKSVTNFFIDGSILYDFYVSPSDAAPTLADYPHMKDGSTYTTLDTSATPAVTKTYIFENGLWTEYVDEVQTGGGDTPTPTLESVTLGWVDFNASESGAELAEVAEFESGDILNSETLYQRGYVPCVIMYTPDSVQFATSQGPYPLLDIVMANEYPQMSTNADFVQNNNPAYIDTGSGNYYEVYGLPGATDTISVGLGWNGEFVTGTLSLKVKSPP